MPRQRYFYNVVKRHSKYGFSPVGTPRPSVELQYEDWVYLQIPRGTISSIPPDVRFAKVEFFKGEDTNEENAVAVWVRGQDGSWSLTEGANHYRVEDGTPESPGVVRAIKITNVEQLQPGESDAHRFKTWFSDGGCLDPELINRG